MPEKGKWAVPSWHVKLSHSAKLPQRGLKCRHRELAGIFGKRLPGCAGYPAEGQDIP